MKIIPRIHLLPYAALVAACLGGFLATASAADEIVIDTNFKPATPTAAPVDLAGSANPDGTLPLKAPSKAAAAKPSTLMAVATQEKSPRYQAVFDVQPRPETADATADVWMNWDVRPAGLNSGVCELTYDFVLLSEPMQGAAIGVELATADGKPIKTEVPIHPTQGIRAGIDGKGKYRAGSGGAQSTSGDCVLHAKLVIDMDKHTWSAYLDDAMVVEDRAFATTLLEAEPSPIISQIFFGSSGGLADKAPFKYALLNVRLVRKGK